MLAAEGNSVLHIGDLVWRAKCTVWPSCASHLICAACNPKALIFSCALHSFGTHSYAGADSILQI